MSDVGDGHVDDEPAGIVGRRVGLGVHRIVMIFRVRRIDRDKRNVPPILAAMVRRRRGGVGFKLRLAAEHGWNAVRMNRDQADSALAFE